MLKAVFFDLDGTLIDSTDAILESFYFMFDAIGEARPTREKILTGIGHPVEVELTRLTDRDPVECQRIYRKRYDEIAADRTTLLPGAHEMLAAFRAAGLRCGLVTSKQRQSAEKLLQHFGVLEYFDCRIGPHDVQNPKPHPEPLLTAAASVGVEPGEALYVGDMYFDAHAAAAAGMRCVCVTTGMQPREELEKLEVEAVLNGLDDVRVYVLAHLDGP